MKKEIVVYDMASKEDGGMKGYTRPLAIEAPLRFEDCSIQTAENLSRRLTIIRATSFHLRQMRSEILAVLILQDGERFGALGETVEEATDDVFQLVMEYSSCPSA